MPESVPCYRDEPPQYRRRNPDEHEDRPKNDDGEFCTGR